MPEPDFRLDFFLFILKFPLLTLSMNNNCFCSNPSNTLASKQMLTQS